MKENNVTIYQFEQNDVRMVQKGGEPWFVLSDLCKVLELSNSRKVAERLDADEKGVTQTYTPGGRQKLTVVNESGMYAVILRSDKPQAKPFRKWVTSEVLPSIRKTGKYQMKQSDDLKAKRVETAQANANVRKANLLLKIADGTQTAYKQVLQAHATKLLTGEFLLPLPEVDERTYSAGEIAEILGVSANKIGRLSNENGMKTEYYGKWFYDKSRHSDKQVETFRYFERAIEVFRKLLEVAA